jgi:hypothetical protein
MTSENDGGKARRVVPVLITWDVDPDLWLPYDRRILGLETAIGLCEREGIPGTFFVTAGPADAIVETLGQMQASGHEIGCHGLTHGSEENYDRMPEDMQRAYIEQATEKLQALTETPMRAFRGPRVKMSGTTLRLLAEYGYLADSSVCSQRLDLISSNLINPGWLFAPRRPYRPNQDSAFKRGDVGIWEIPVSAAIVPFISSSMQVLGLSFMKMLFKLLYLESRCTGKPITYLAHPTEFAVRSGKTGVARVKKQWKKYTKPQYLTPSYLRAHGFRLRTLLYRLDAETKVAYSRELFAYMRSFPDVAFMTVSQYTTTCLSGAEGRTRP